MLSGHILLLQKALDHLPVRIEPLPLKVSDCLMNCVDGSVSTPYKLDFRLQF